MYFGNSRVPRGKVQVALQDAESAAALLHTLFGKPQEPWVTNSKRKCRCEYANFSCYCRRSFTLSELGHRHETNDPGSWRQGPRGTSQKRNAVLLNGSPSKPTSISHIGLGMDATSGCGLPEHGEVSKSCGSNMMPSSLWLVQVAQCPV